MKADASSAEVQPGVIARFYGYLKPYKAKLAVIFVFLVLVSMMDLVRPWLIGKVVDAVASGGGFSKVLPYLVLFLAVVIVRSIFLLIRNYQLQKTGMRVTCDMRVSIFSHLQKLSLKFYERKHTGKIVSRITEDTGAMHVLVTGASVNMLGDAITILGVMGFLLYSNWKLALVTYAVLPFFIMNFVWHKRRLRVESRRHRRNWDKVLGFLYERISSNRLVRAFATEEIEISQFRGGIESDFNNYNRVVWRNTLLSVGAETISGLGTLAVLGYGAYLAVHGVDGFTIGQLTAFNFYLGMLYMPITRIVETNAVIQRAIVALEKIFVVMDTKPHVPENDQLPPLPAMAGDVEFDHVTFGYRPGHPILKDVSFRVAPGQMVALVGPSGAGKSTIITLLARFYDTDEGRILVDGKNIRDFNLQSLRRQVGIVMQENILFSGSIEENIKYGRPGATDEEMYEAARAANIHDFISELPHGYESSIGERGVTLSGGQRQRIAIARVILKDPAILILDEATSALDTESERLIQDALEKLMKNRTSLVIAHRLSTVVNADNILVMEHGRIAEQGKHEELVARADGLYAKLHRMQFRETDE